MMDKKSHECEFIVILSFPLLVSQSQGQSLDHVGIYVLKAVFGCSHIIVALTGRRNLWNVKTVRYMNQQGKVLSDVQTFTRSVGIEVYFQLRTAAF
jgi:hypothetical protein